MEDEWHSGTTPDGTMPLQARRLHLQRQATSRRACFHVGGYSSEYSKKSPLSAASGRNHRQTKGRCCTHPPQKCPVSRDARNVVVHLLWDCNANTIVVRVTSVCRTPGSLHRRPRPRSSPGSTSTRCISFTLALIPRDRDVNVVAALATPCTRWAFHTGVPSLKTRHTRASQSRWTSSDVARVWSALSSGTCPSLRYMPFPTSC